MRLALLLAAFVAACGDPPSPAATADPEDLPIPYRLAVPDAVVELAGELREISGLTVLPSGRLGAVQDEDGLIYELDPATGAILDRLPFADAGDYEGVELVPDRAVWVLRADGDLYRVFRDSTGAPAVRTFETALRGRNDTEGLAYDPAGDRLLVAAKAWPGPDLGDVRAIYGVDLRTGAVTERPVAVLPRRNVDGRTNFRPSALAVHPETGEWYVLSSVREAIAVLTPEGVLRAVVDFPAGLLSQPEGLAFGPDGTLFVASEGTTGPAKIARFARLP